MVCKGCEKRHINCHSTCEAYKEWKRQHDERNDQIRKAKEQEQLYKNYLYNVIDKGQKRKSKRRVGQK